MIGSRPQHASLKVEARDHHLSEVRDFVARICRAAGLPGGDISNVKLAVDEACTNIIQHAYQNRAGEIEVDVAYCTGRVEVRLRDRGDGFDFASIKAPDLEHYVAIGKRGGLGVYLINKIMDEVEYATVGDINELVMVVDRRPPLDRWIPGFQFSALHRSLRMRFIIRATVGLAVLVATSLGLLHVNQRGSLLQGQLMQAETSARDLAVKAQSVLSMSRPYVLEHTLLQQAVVELVDHDADVSYARVVRGVDGVVWADNLLHHMFELDQPVPGEAWAPTLEGGFWRRATPPTGESYEVRYSVRLESANGETVELGHVVVGIPRVVVQSDLNAALVQTILIGILAFIIGSALILVMVNLFVRPIQRLTEGVLAIGDGVLVEDIEVEGPEEISTIAEAFNEIAGKFRHAQEHLVEQERLQKEMQLAREIQHTLLPTEMPELAGYEISAMYRAAAEVGGDYYDFFTVDEDTTGIVVADVSGKGIPGSLVMTMIRTALRMEARGNHSASDVMARVNTFITEDMRKGMFITLFYVILDSKNRVVSYASAGHNPMMLYRKETDEVFYLNPRGFPVGISLPDPELFAKTIDVEKLQLQQDDLLLAYTDGVTEAMNNDREQYGEARLVDCMRRNAGMTAEEFIEELNRDVAAFTGDFPQNDDITVVAIKEKLRPASLEIERRQTLLDMVEAQGMEIEAACADYGVSVSTFYRWRRMRDRGGVEALASSASGKRLRRLNVTERERMLELIREQPELGAKRLADALAAGGSDISDRMVYEELVRLDLNNESKRRRYLQRRGWLKPDGPPGLPAPPYVEELDRRLLLPGPDDEDDGSEPEIPVGVVPEDTE